MNVFLFFPQTHVCDIQNPQWLFFAKNPLGNLQNYFCSRDCVSSISNSAKVWKQISKLFWSSLPTLHIFSSADCSVVLIRFSMIENKNGMLVALFRNKRLMLDEMTRWNGSKFAIFYTCIRKPKVAFSVFYFVLLNFSLMNALVYIYMHRGKNVAWNQKMM